METHKGSAAFFVPIHIAALKNLRCGNNRLDEAKRELWVQFADMEEYQRREGELLELLRDSDGQDPVVIYLAKERAVKRLGANRSVLADEALISRLKAKLGEKNIKLWEKSIEKL